MDEKVKTDLFPLGGPLGLLVKVLTEVYPIPCAKKLKPFDTFNNNRVLKPIVVSTHTKMFRRSRYSYTQEDYEDRYYSECRCPTEFYDDDDGETYTVGSEPSPCPYCKREELRVRAAAAKEEQLKKNPFYDKIVAIREQLKKVDAAQQLVHQLEGVRGLFTVLLDCEEFLAVTPKLRYTAINKAAEFRKHKVAGEQLKELFDHFDQLMVRVTQREDSVP